MSEKPQYKIAILEGDGIGPEIMAEALKVLRQVEAKWNVRFDCVRAPFGGNAYFQCGKSFPTEAMDVCDSADAILKGPIGLSFSESQKIPVEEQPERGALLPLRRRYETYANFRPVKLPPGMGHFSPLKPEVIGAGIDIMMIRELVGGLYFGAKERGTDSHGRRYVKESLEYDEDQIRKILRVAFEEAGKRKKILHNVHKSNVLISSVLWNEVLDEVAKDYPDVKVCHIIVDAAATALCINPSQFDCMVMENMFGDILSDLGGGILGSLGLMPSACVGDTKAYYEPSHGSAPDIAGQNKANPYAMIGSVAMMLEKSFELSKASEAIWKAMYAVYQEGFVTQDLAGAHGNLSHLKIVSTAEFGDQVCQKF